MRGAACLLYYSRVEQVPRSSDDLSGLLMNFGKMVYDRHGQVKCSPFQPRKSPKGKSKGGVRNWGECGGVEANQFDL